MKRLILIALLSVTVPALAFIGGGGSSDFAANAYHADNMDNASGTNTWLDSPMVTGVLNKGNALYLATSNNAARVLDLTADINPSAYFHSAGAFGNPSLDGYVRFVNLIPGSSGYFAFIDYSTGPNTYAPIKADVSQLVGTLPALDGGNLLNLSASQLTGTAPNSVLPGNVVTNLGGMGAPLAPLFSVGSLYEFQSGESFVGSFSGATPTTWPDVSGNGRSLNLSGTVVSMEAVGDRPGLYFNGSALASNAVLNATMTGGGGTNFTMVFVYRSFIYGVRALACSGTGGTDGMFLYPGYANLDEWQFNKQGANYQIQSTPQPSGKLQVVILTVNSNIVTVWRNQRLVANSTEFGNGLPSGGAGLVQNLYLGNDSDGASAPQVMNMAAFLIYSNALNVSKIKAVGKCLTDFYGGRKPSLMLEGESQQEGYGTTQPGQNPLAVLETAYPDYSIEAGCRAGNTSANIYSNVLLNACTPANVVWLHCNAGNGESFASITSNIPQICALLHSNGTLVLLSTPLSFQSENGTVRTNVATWMEQTWTNYADGLADSYADTNYGIYGAFGTGVNSNLVYSSDHTHFAPYGVTNWVQTYIIPAFQKMLLSHNLYTSLIGGYYTNTAIMTVTANGLLSIGTNLFGGGGTVLGSTISNSVATPGTVTATNGVQTGSGVALWSISTNASGSLIISNQFGTQLTVTTNGTFSGTTLKAGSAAFSQTSLSFNDWGAALNWGGSSSYGINSSSGFIKMASGGPATISTNFCFPTNSYPLAPLAAGFCGFAASNYDLYWVTPTKTNIVTLGH